MSGRNGQEDWVGWGLKERWGRGFLWYNNIRNVASLRREKKERVYIRIYINCREGDGGEDRSCQMLTRVRTKFKGIMRAWRWWKWIFRLSKSDFDGNNGLFLEGTAVMILRLLLLLF